MVVTGFENTGFWVRVAVFANWLVLFSYILVTADSVDFVGKHLTFLGKLILIKLVDSQEEWLACEQQLKMALICS